MRIEPFTEDHDQLRQTIRRWVAEEITPHAAEWEAEGIFPREVFTRAGDLGFLGLSVPEEWGSTQACRADEAAAGKETSDLNAACPHLRLEAVAATLPTSWASSCGTTLPETGAETRARSRRAAMSSLRSMDGREAPITVAPGRAAPGCGSVLAGGGGARGSGECCYWRHVTEGCLGLNLVRVNEL